MLMLRLGGLLLSFGIIGYLLYSIFSADSKVEKSIANNPTVQEQKKALKDAGVDADDKKALNKNLDDAVKQLENYQKQADDLQKGDPP